MSSVTTKPRKQAARLPVPAARYRKGQAPKGAAEVPSDSEEEDEEQEAPQEDGDVLIGGVGEEDEDEDEGGLEIRAREEAKAARPVVALRDVNISKDGKVIVAGREEVGKTLAELEEEEEEEEEAEEEEEEETSEEEESEEEKPKLLFRPVFVPKRGRATIAEREAMAEDSEEVIRKREEEAEERRKQSHDLVAESIRRELAEKEKEAEVPDVDDTDGPDPEGEFEAWRLRELARIKRDQEAAVAREVERAEVERRRALPEAQRLQEDLAHASELRAAKPKGQQKFLQKYWHKGAFHQDEDILRRHDFTEATESTVDVSVLPQVMQVKNFGKRSRTKYTHLLDQDTTVGSGGFGGTAPVKAGGTSTAGGGCFLCGGPHLKKDCPQNREIPPGLRGGGTGANRTDVGTRQWGARDRDGKDERRPGRDREGDHGRDAEEDEDTRDRRRFNRDEIREKTRDRYERDRFDERDRDRRGDKFGGREKGETYGRDRRRSYSRSRSRSPPRRDRRDEEYARRRRSRERSVDYDHREKRRRMD